MVAKKSGLGKGLDALIPAGNKKAPVKKETEPVIIEKIVEKKGVETLKITEVEPNREQPRKNFNEDALLELSDSYRKKKIITRSLQGREDGGQQKWLALKRFRLSSKTIVINR